MSNCDHEHIKVGLWTDALYREHPFFKCRKCGDEQYRDPNQKELSMNQPKPYWIIEIEGISFRFTQNRTQVITCALNDPLIEKHETEAEAFKWGETLERLSPWMKGRWKATEHMQIDANPATDNAEQPISECLRCRKRLNNGGIPKFYASTESDAGGVYPAMVRCEQCRHEVRCGTTREPAVSEWNREQKEQPQAPQRPPTTLWVTDPFTYGSMCEARMDHLEAELTRVKAERDRLREACKKLYEALKGARTFDTKKIRNAAPIALRAYERFAALTPPPAKEESEVYVTYRLPDDYGDSRWRTVHNGAAFHHNTPEGSLHAAFIYVPAKEKP